MEAREWTNGSRPLSKTWKTLKNTLERHALPDERRLELSKSVRKSGLQSDDPPSKFGLERVRLSKIEQEELRSSSKIGSESVDSPSKIKQEELRSASKIGSESVDSPPKDGLESFKSLPKSDPVPHGDFAHSNTPEIEVAVPIYIGQAYRRTCIIKVDRDATILELTHRVHQQTGVPLDQMKLFYNGNILQDIWDKQEKLSACSIDGSSIMTLVVREPIDGQIYLPTGPNTTTRVESTNEVQATSDDYDEDLYIVDPQAHFDMLSQLERNVLRRSEYFQAKREYSLSTALDPVDDDGAFLDEIGLRVSLTRRIRRSSIVTRTIQEKEPSSAAFWHLLKSYSIVLNASQSLKQMVKLHFCKNAINILVFHELPEVIEIRTVPSTMIMNIEGRLEAFLSLVLDTDLEERSFALLLNNAVMPPCRRLLEQVGSHLHPLTLNLSELSAVVREAALLIDLGLVSYVRSHGSGFDNIYFANELSQLEVKNADELVFGCYWTRLACLDSFLDRRKVWVFDFPHPDRRRDDSPHQKKGPKSLLARKEDLADIWGPVYTVPTSTGLVKYYGVSKGIIYRIKSKKESPIQGAKLCHYSSRSSFVRKKASGLLANMDELALSQDDLLLIGAGFREKANCQYTMSAFIKESASAMTVLGTKDSVWQMDSRGLAVGLSKYLGVTVSGTQKLIPQTTLKQHILDKWTTMPSRSNPAVLNQYLGVEFSHCTGNARRISLKMLMISKPIRPILERQIPDWHQTPWGKALNEALHSPDREKIVNVWKEHASNRSDIADLVCCVLQVLNHTGWNGQKGFNSAVLIDNEEWAVSVPGNLNSWLVALKDTHLTSAYVITSEICFGCAVPDRTISTCNTPQAFTALQTQITTEESPSDSKAEFLLKPFGERFRRTDGGSSAIFLLSPNLRHFPRMLSRTKSYECSELLNRTKYHRFRRTVYLRASTRSYRGRYEVKDTIVAKLSSSLRQYRNAPDRGRILDVDRPISQLEEITDQHVGLRLPRQESTQGPMSLTQTPLTKHEIGVPTVMAQKTTHPVAYARNKPEQASLRDELLLSCTRINARAPAHWPMGTSMPESKEIQELIYSDVHGQDTYDFNSDQAKSRIPRKSIGCSEVRSSCPVTPEAIGNGLDTTLHDFANSTLGDENDSDPDSMITPLPQRLPAGIHSPEAGVRLGLAEIGHSATAKNRPLELRYEIL
ncbi:MAG: hypothetical protein LQ349_006558 [Xanthoria aureola]|nr:MAG: hypothetical protein LQ349_006558 [Xanthoria aureola]